jgi:hypothetical protein
VQRALTNLRARLGSLRAIFFVPGAQVAVLGLTVVVTQLPAAPSPLALAMADDDLASAARPESRRVRLVAVPPAAVATEAAPPRDHKKDVTTYTAVQRFDFADEHVLADVQGPEGEKLTAVPRATHDSLIEIRQHFVPEIVKSLEEY